MATAGCKGCGRGVGKKGSVCGLCYDGLKRELSKARRAGTMAEASLHGVQAEKQRLLGELGTAVVDKAKAEDAALEALHLVKGLRWELVQKGVTLGEALARERRAVGVVADVARLRGQADAVLDDYAATGAIVPGDVPLAATLPEAQRDAAVDFANDYRRNAMCGKPVMLENPGTVQSCVRPTGHEGKHKTDDGQFYDDAPAGDGSRTNYG